MKNYLCIKTIGHCFTKNKTYILQEFESWSICDGYYVCDCDDEGDRHELWLSQLGESFIPSIQPVNKLKKHKLGEICEKKILEYF